MLQDIEDYTVDLKYDGLCPGFYDKINLTSHVTYEEQTDRLQNEGNNIPAMVHYPEYEGTGDNSDISLITEEQVISRADELSVINLNNDYATKINNCGEAPGRSNPHKNLKIRYTRQYLLNCRKNSLSNIFPDCLFKYLFTDDVPIKRTMRNDGLYQDGVQPDLRSLDHILFYSSLPYRPAPTKRSSR